ncbi:MAG: ATP-binding protein [Dehalococcoidia bacterium]
MTSEEQHFARLKAFVEDVPDMIGFASLDDPLHRLYMNPAGLNMLGLESIADRNTQNVTDFFNHDEVHHILESVVPAIRRGETWVEEAKIRNSKTGEVVPVHRRVFPITDQDTGKPMAFGVINRDIRDLKRSEESLREAIEEKEALVRLVQDLYRRERRRSDHLQIIQDITTTASSILDLDELLAYVVNMIQRRFGYYLVAIYIMHPESRVLALRALACSGDSPLPRGHRLEPGSRSVTNIAADRSEPVMVANADDDNCDSDVLAMTGAKSQLAVPIKLGDEVLGVLDIQSETANAFDELDQSLMQTLSNHIAVAMQNARLFILTRDQGIQAERTRLAREIHDSLMQKLSGMHFLLAGLEAPAANLDDEARAMFEQVGDLARESIRDARHAIWDLRPTALENGSLVEALKAEAVRACDHGSIVCHFAVEGDQKSLSPSDQGAILRVCQEAINNALRHSAAENVYVTLHFEDPDVRLVVRDDGRGFETPPTETETSATGYGLTSMRERAALLGGHLSVESAPGVGTTVTLSIPSGPAKQ